MNMFRKIVGPAAFGLSFIQQITQKDITSASNFNSLSNTNKAQFIGADILYRITGINAAPTVLTNPGPWGINPKGALNKWLGLGIASTVYGHYAPKGFPAKAMAKKIGGGLMVGGVVGGVLDNPPITINNTSFGQSNSTNYSSSMGGNGIA
jgi:hypothetical protein